MCINKKNIVFLISMLVQLATVVKAANNVKDFGAVGDGVANDTNAINMALAALPSSGGQVFFPAGSYRTEGINITGSNIVLCGEGVGNTTIRLMNTDSCVRIGTGGVPSWVYGSGLRELKIDGYDTYDQSWAAVGVDMDYTSESTFRTVRIDHCTSVGLQLTRSSIDRFEDLTVGSCDTNVDLIVASADVFISGNFWNAGTTHFRVRTATDLTVLGAWFERGPTAFLLDNTDEDVSFLHGLISGCSFVFDGTTQNNCFVRMTSNNTSHWVKIHQFDITSNRIHFGDTVPSYAISLDFSAVNVASNIMLGLDRNYFTSGPQTALVYNSNSSFYNLKLGIGTNDTACTTPLSGKGTVTGMEASGSYGGVENKIRAPLNYDTDAGVCRDIRFKSGGVDRWYLRVDNTTEGSGNSGSDFCIIRRDNNGSNLGSPLWISRATGQVTIANPVVLSNLPVYTNNAAAIAGGLAVGRLYRTATGQVMVVYP